MEASFYQSSGVQGDGAGSNAKGSSGVQQKMLCPLAHHSPPAVWPSAQQATDWYQFAAQGWGTPASQDCSTKQLWRNPPSQCLRQETEPGAGWSVVPGGLGISTLLTPAHSLLPSLLYRSPQHTDVLSQCTV